MSTQVPPSRLDSTKDFSSLVPSAYAKANAAFAQANAAFSQANTGGGADSWARDTANAGFITANSAASFANGSFLTANSSSSFANGAFDRANAAFNQANTGGTDAWVRTQANNAYDAANSSGSFANGAFLTANSGASFANGAFDRANASYTKANTTIIYTASSTAPSSPKPGDQWYLTTTDVLYEYINDGTSNNWVDIISPTMSNNSTGSGGTSVAKVVGYNLVFGG